MPASAPTAAGKAPTGGATMETGPLECLNWTALEGRPRECCKWTHALPSGGAAPDAQATMPARDPHALTTLSLKKTKSWSNISQLTPKAASCEAQASDTAPSSSPAPSLAPSPSSQERGVTGSLSVLSTTNVWPQHSQRTLSAVDIGRRARPMPLSSVKYGVGVKGFDTQ